MLEPRQFLRSLFDAAVASALPKNCMHAWLPTKPGGRVIVIGAGKAAASMAEQLESAWSGPLEGQVIVPHGYSANCQWIKVIEASHPVPDDAGVAAAASILKSVENLTANDTVVCLISGGGSSLLCLPAADVTLVDKQSITSQLLKSGAAIHEINCVRKKLSAIKGGKLAAACAPATVVTLVISDIPGNDASMVASGPTMSDHSLPSEALEIIARYNISLSPATRTAVERSTPVTIADADVRILATSDDALLSAAALAAENDVTPYSLGDLAGNATQLAGEHAQLALQIAAGDGPVATPCVIISGGETTVNVRGTGHGGRNTEYGLALAIALAEHPTIHALACDTDGIDGISDSAGCYVSPDALKRARIAGVDANTLLNENDSNTFFAAINDLIVTGATRTNVNDFRAILIT